jgi:hypothetical protein
MVATVFYFFFLLILVPVIGLIERQILSGSEGKSEINNIDDLLNDTNSIKYL